MGIQTISKTIDLQSPSKIMSKHITEIGDSGIKVHATEGVNSNYVEIDSDGLEIYKDGVSVASYGDTTKIGKDDEKHIEITPTAFTVFDEDSSTPFAISTSKSKRTLTKGFGTSVGSNQESYYSWYANIYLKGILVDNRIYFGTSSSGYPTEFNDYIDLPANPTSYPSLIQRITVNGVNCEAQWVDTSIVYIRFENTTNSRVYLVSFEILLTSAAGKSLAAIV